MLYLSLSILYKILEDFISVINNTQSQFYVNFVAVKDVRLESEFVKLWSKIFKESEIVTVTNSK